jgi:hypothetical protein
MHGARRLCFGSRDLGCRLLTGVCSFAGHPPASAASQVSTLSVAEVVGSPHVPSALPTPSVQSLSVVGFGHAMVDVADGGTFSDDASGTEEEEEEEASSTVPGASGKALYAGGCGVGTVSRWGCVTKRLCHAWTVHHMRVGGGMGHDRPARPPECDQ